VTDKPGDRNIDTVIFDFDGTIMDTNEIVMSSWQYAARELLGHELPKDTLTSTFGEPIAHSVESLFPGCDPDLAVKLYRDFHHEHYADMIGLFPGVREMLEALEGEGYKLGLVTNRLRRTTEIGLRQFDIEKYFGVVVTVGEAPKDKPEPEHIWFALDHLGSAQGRAVLVGDSRNDIIGGHNAGLIAILVAWSMATSENCSEDANEPDYVIDAPTDLLPLLHQLNR
jgi:pyrophosphatase PpaX